MLSSGMTYIHTHTHGYGREREKRKDKETGEGVKTRNAPLLYLPSLRLVLSFFFSSGYACVMTFLWYIVLWWCKGNTDD